MNPKLCDQCNKPLIVGVNARTYQNKRCSNVVNTGKLTPCQIARNRQTSSDSMLQEQEENMRSTEEIQKRYNYVEEEGKRTCLKCNCIFVSRSRFNRICNKHDQTPEANENDLIQLGRKIARHYRKLGYELTFND